MERLKFKHKLLLVLALAAVIRILGSGMALFGDETLFAENVRNLEFLDYYAAHPPLSMWIHNLAGLIFGESVVVMRLTVALFSMLTILLTMLLAKDRFGERTALIAGLLLATSPWFLAGSLQLDIVGSFLTFFYMLSFFFYLNYLSTKQNKYLHWTGISIGLGLLTNYSAVLIFPILFGHYWISQRGRTFSYKDFIWKFFKIGILAGLTFSIFPIWSFISGSPAFIDSVSHPVDLIKAEPGSGLRPTGGLNITLLLIQYFNALIWIGPLLLFGSALYLIESKKNETSKLFIFQAILIFLFFTFVIKDNFRPIEKYLLVLAPGLCILSAEYVKDFLHSKKHIYVFSILFAVYTVLLFLLNLKNAEYLPFYPKQAYLESALNGLWNIKLPLLGHAGPIGFYITLDTILISFLISAALLLMYLIFKKKIAQNHVSYAIVGILALGFSYNAFLSEELLLSTTGPDISTVTKEMVSYITENPLPEPVHFFRNVAFEYYLESAYPVARSGNGKPMFTRQIDFDAENNQEKIKKLDKSNVVVVNFPKINTNSLLWQRLQDCERVKSFYDKGEEVGFIVRC